MIREEPETAKITSGVWLHLLYSSRLPETSEKKQRLVWPCSSRPSLLVWIAWSCCYWIAVWGEGRPVHLSGAGSQERQAALGSDALLMTGQRPHSSKVPLYLISATGAEGASSSGDTPDFLDPK